MPEHQSVTRASREILFAALEQQIGALGQSFEIVVIGGSALQALGLISRATRDVDIVALIGSDELVSADPLPSSLLTAASRVADDFGLPKEWLNAGPADLLRLGLPQGFSSRLEPRTFGPALMVHFAGRYDQIHFKLYAMVDQGAGRHEADLRALEPSVEELSSAALWARTHDPSPGFRQELIAVLRHLGVPDANVGP